MIVIVIEIVLLVVALPRWSRAVMLIECVLDDAPGHTMYDWVPTGAESPLTVTAWLTLLTSPTELVQSSSTRFGPTYSGDSVGALGAVVSAGAS